jgi:hypothetical protein
VAAYPKGQNSNPAEGLLTFIDNGVDPQTATIKLKATFRNKDRLPSAISPKRCHRVALSWTMTATVGWIFIS